MHMNIHKCNSNSTHEYLEEGCCDWSTFLGLGAVVGAAVFTGGGEKAGVSTEGVTG